MEDALRILDNGKAIKVYALKLSEQDKAFDFICPDCRTYLDLRMGYDRKYFAHHRNEVKRLNRENCPRYHDVEDIKITYQDVSNMTGYTLLIDTHRDSNKLYIALPKLFNSEMDRDVETIEKVRIYNSSGKQVFIDIKDLLFSDVKCPLNFSANEYYCEFINMRGDTVNKKGSSYIRTTIGLDHERGGLFRDNRYEMGKRLLEGSQITVGKSYLYLTPFNIQSVPKEIEHKRLGELKLYTSSSSAESWRITRIQANILNEASCAFFRKMGIELVDKESRLNIVWPPCQNDGSTVKTTEKSTLLISYYNFGREFERVVQTNCDDLNRVDLHPEIINDNYKLIETNDFCDSAHFQIRGRTTPSVLEITRASKTAELGIQEVELSLEFSNGVILKTNEQELISDDVFFKGATNPKLIHIRKGAIKKVGNKRINKLRPSDSLIMNNRAWGVVEYSFLVNQKEFIGDPNIDFLLKRIIQAAGRDNCTTINLPYWLKEIIWYCKRVEDIDITTQMLLRGWLINSHVPSQVLPLLKDLYINIGGKRNVQA